LKKKLGEDSETRKNKGQGRGQQGQLDEKRDKEGATSFKMPSIKASA
jgi:hypothetical protein